MEERPAPPRHLDTSMRILPLLVMARAGASVRFFSPPQSSWLLVDLTDHIAHFDGSGSETSLLDAFAVLINRLPLLVPV
jgi:small-conductance mechanosensitive channel